MIHNGDIGTIIQATVKDGSSSVDVSSANSVKFSAHPPGGTVKSWTTSNVSDGTDGKVQYTTLSGDVNVPGNWVIQVLVTFSATKILRSVPVSLIVGQRLDAA